MMELKQKIEETLSHVIDPETMMDVIRMRLVKDLEVHDDGTVSLTFIPSSPVCPLGFQLAIMIRDAIRSIDGVKDVTMDVRDFVHAEALKKILNES